ncbi:MAG: hypothetical protein LBG80_06570 [Bacteroidales bacterium]|jgi:hypothetical protein|nr:hypothetical protein [Bacteroidales bacterium]
MDKQQLKQIHDEELVNIFFNKTEQSEEILANVKEELKKRKIDVAEITSPKDIIPVIIKNKLAFGLKKLLDDQRTSPALQEAAKQKLDAVIQKADQDADERKMQGEEEYVPSIVPLCFGLVGVFIYKITRYFVKIELSDGTKVPRYNKRTRRNALIIIIIFVSIIVLLLFFFNNQ